MHFTCPQTELKEEQRKSQQIMQEKQKKVEELKQTVNTVKVNLVNWLILICQMPQAGKSMAMSGYWHSPGFWQGSWLVGELLGD